MTLQPLTTDQWNEIKSVKDGIRDYSLNTNHALIRNISRGTLISGFDPNIWNDNYGSDTYIDVLTSGEFFDLVGQNYKYVQGGLIKEADAQFLTHYNHRNKFNDATEIWTDFTFVSGQYLPTYISGTNDLVSGNCYQMVAIKDLPHDYEISIFMKLKKPNE